MTARRRHRSAAAPSAAPASPSVWSSASGLPLLFLLLVAGPGSGESRALRVTNGENMQEQHHFSEGQDRRLKAGYRHLGCFRFDAGDGRMTKKLEAIDMTLEMCDEACNGDGSKSSYFATERGEECWCTADSHFDYSSGGVGLCNRWCGGDGSAMCGGQDARDVFATEIGPAAGPKLMAQAGATAGPLDSLLGLHNEARCMHGAGPLSFAEPVAITARAYAEILTSDDNCGSMEAEHSTGLGENVFVCSNPVGDRTECFTPQGAMDYFYESQIDSGLPSTYGPLATQLLWGPTSQLGCAFERCISKGFAYNVLVCHYSPPVSYGTPTGNEVGPVTKTQEECAPQQ